MKKRRFIFTIYLLISTTVLFAQVGPEGSKAEEKQDTNSDIKNIQLAYSLADYGYENDSASALLSAVEILIQIPTQEGTFEKEQKGEQGEKAPSDRKDYSTEKLLADAKELAGKDKELLKRVKSLEKALKSSTRGASGGPLSDYGVSYGNGGVNYHIWFDGGRLAEVFVYSLDGADFDMYIYDDRGNLLCYDERYNWDAYGFWHPRRTGRYTIMIKNRSRYNSSYIMYTN